MKNLDTISTTKLTKGVYLLLFLLVLSFSGYSQNVGINATGNPPNANAGLDVDFANKGILIPRVALTGTANAAPLAAHVAGMIVYNTATTGDVTPGFYYNNGTRWIASMPNGTAVGDMLYWNGSAWVRVPAGTPGQFLQFSPASIPVWTGSAFASLTTAAASSILDITATSGGEVVSDGGSPVISYGVCWSTVPGPTIANTKTTDGSGTGIFTSYLTGLVPSTTYFARAYSINNTTISYGNEITFTTTTPTIPVLDPTTAATNVLATTATTGGNLTSNGNGVISERGICYSTSNPPTIADATLIDPGTGTGAFISNMTGLVSNTVYYVRSYATNSAGTGYGAVISFTTQAIVSSTTAITAITTTGASSGGTITAGGGAAITERGVCWSTSANPTIADPKTSDGTTTGTFTSIITGCAYTTLYHVRAYATNAGGTVYGNDVSFTTLTPVAPTLAATTAATSITGSSANSGGNVTSTGGAPILERGVCYSTTSNPTTAGLKVVDPAPGGGIFTSAISGLTGGTTYYVRAYAINFVGTSYGTQISFTTTVIPPTLYTVAASSITGGAAVSGGSMNWNGPGYSNYQYYGVCYSTTPGSATPTYVNTNTLNYSVNPAVNIAPWVTNLTGLTASTTYYIRSFLHVYRGGWIIVYGNELSFTTSAPTAPAITSTTAITAITDRSANSGGTISSDGGSPILAKGVCWSTSPNPVLGVGNFTSNGTGTASYISNITGLTGSTIYYVRAYATNAIGTSYGPVDVSFTTLIQSPYALGQSVGYGWVVYIDPATGGGLIVSPDISSTVQWGCSGTSIATATLLGTGQANTNLILSSCATRPIAASVADDYTGGGFTDWYLPSQGEMAKIGALATTIGMGSSTNNYYTSSQVNATTAYSWFTNFSSGYASSVAKTPGPTSYVSFLRVIRNFAPIPPVAPTVLSTTAISSITATGGASGGYISSTGGAIISARGVCWSSAGTPTIADPKTTDGTGMGSFTSAITGLTTGIPYFVRAYATNSAGTSYGPEISFTPVAPGFPNVTTTAISNIGATTATSGGNVISDGGGAVTSRGVCWSTIPGPTTADSKTDDGGGLGTFTSAITGLITGTPYYVRAYATNATGTTYGVEYSFTPFTFATLTTDAITNIAATSATSGGNITSDGSSAVTERGVCWSTITNPTIADTKTSDGAGSGIFVSSITGLVTGTPYFVRAYATNAAGTAYGNEQTFTPSGPTIPTVTTDIISSPTPTGGTSGGNVTSDGTLTVTARGVCWSDMNYPPTIADSKTTDGSGTGTFTSNITGLTTGWGYWYAAYATNSMGTAYGSVEYYVPMGLPTVSTSTLVYNVPDAFAQLPVYVPNTGGGTLSAYGVVWGLTSNPTVASNLGITAEDLLNYWNFQNALISPINPDGTVTYYIRAYATTEVGTTYGAEIIFTPGVLSIPTVTTDPIMNKIGALAEGGGTVLSDGGDPLISAGLCWGTAADPTVESNLGMTTDGYTGQFYSLMTGLTVGTVYHVRGYATNSTGTGYGADLIFTATAATIGQVVQGATINGIVFSVDGTGSHGLMATPWSLGGEADWGCGTTLLGTGTAVGTGLSNTTAINDDNFNNSCVSASVFPGFAAEVASWQGWILPSFLPSKDEFDLLWTNASAAGIPVTSAAVQKFWSSSEVDGTNVWYFDAETDPLNPVWVNTGAKDAMYTPWPIYSF